MSAGRTDLNEDAGFHQKCEGQISHRRMESVPDETPPNVSVALSAVMHRNRPVAVTNEVPTTNIRVSLSVKEDGSASRGLAILLIRNALR